MCYCEQSEAIPLYALSGAYPLDPQPREVHGPEAALFADPHVPEVAPLHAEKGRPEGIDRDLVDTDDDGIQFLHVLQIASLRAVGGEDPHRIEYGQGRFHGEGEIYEALIELLVDRVPRPTPHAHPVL